MADLQSHNSLDYRVQKPSSSTPPHNGSSAGSTANPRSCVTCRKRKVKCDKKNPCSNCSRAKIECVFPGPGRAPRKSRKPADSELMERLRKLEGVVQSLHAQVEEHEEQAEQNATDRQNLAEMYHGISTPPAETSRPGPTIARDSSTEGLEARFGRLVVDQGRSRYVNNTFWANLNNEVEDLKSILVDYSDDEGEDVSSPGGSPEDSSQGWLFGYSSSAVDLLAYHPPPKQAIEFWELYKENVEPLGKVLHVPSTEPLIYRAVAQPEQSHKSFDCLLFAIYYGAVTSIAPEECQQRWGENKTLLLQKYRVALEQSLARANFLCCDEMVVLQAFVIFLILLRRNDNPRKVWTLTGLAVRMAQTLGLHRDGTYFNLPPFECEIRRRLWWQICILDARASEDHGCDPSIMDAQFDAKMPSNVNDSDLDPNMTTPPQERIGHTDMTFSIMRFEIARLYRKMFYVPPGPRPCTEYFAGLSIEEKEKWVTDCHKRIEDKYLKNGDMSEPMVWVTSTVWRLVLSKMLLLIYHPHQRRDGGISLPQETRDKLFITSLENIEYSLLLETEARTMKWGWLWRTYVQWHAIAFLLSELSVRTRGRAVDRAWRALEASAATWWGPQISPEGRKSKEGSLWRPLGRLLAKARAAREKDLALQQACQAIQAGLTTSMTAEEIQAQLRKQPDPQCLDSLLRSAAPSYGNVPTGASPEWLSMSPVASPVPSLGGTPMFPLTPAPASNGSPSSRAAGTNKPGNADNTLSLQTAAEQFQNLSSLGLDYVIRDIMNGDPIDADEPLGDHSLHLSPDLPAAQNGGSSADTFMQNSTTIPVPIPNGAASMSPFVPSGTSKGAAADAFSPVLFGGDSWSMADFSPQSSIPNQPPSQTSDSPGFGMDWAAWDNLVRGYGNGMGIPMDISTPSGGPVGSQSLDEGVAPVPGNLALPTWF